MRLSVTSTAKICPIEIAANICATRTIAQLVGSPHSPNYSLLFPAFFTSVHLAFANADNLALAVAETRLF
jgi:hypothetical protein